ncbi:DedA family protein [Paenibacillus sp.]|jgi:membrane protein DedA with SNARE-associated domain|uniref:DedA family protein n=1 Tax=Paenibacillus sp. TaxID=58172 RepID=UPI00281A26BC|nr:DedA family protein [Paenibacillus sp.]MDR0268656.1 DedA family protein [Paenibacillus sp.]
MDDLKVGYPRVGKPTFNVSSCFPYMRQAIKDVIAMNIEALFEQYGYAVLFIGLLLEFIALPFPGEITMLYVGYLISMGTINGWMALFLSFIGTTLGMTVTYLIGLKAGMPFIQRVGKWVFITPSKFDKTKKWFAKRGHFLVFIGYFIPGVRHVTGYLTGILGSNFRTFAIYAYSGALFWCTSFIGLGFVFGPQWDNLLHHLERYSWRIAIILVLLTVVVWLVKRKAQSSRLKALKWDDANKSIKSTDNCP